MKTAKYSIKSKVNVDNVSDWLNQLDCHAARQSGTLLIIVEDSVLVAWKAVLESVIKLHKTHGIKARLIKSSLWIKYGKVIQRETNIGRSGKDSIDTRSLSINSKTSRKRTFKSKHAKSTNNTTTTSTLRRKVLADKRSTKTAIKEKRNLANLGGKRLKK